MYTRAELIILAQTYLAATGVGVHRLGRAVGNPKLFQRLFAGDDCYLAFAERASAFFEEQWPLHVAWPAEVPRAVGRYKLRERRRETTIAA